MRILIALLLMLASPAFACGPDSDCPIGDRSYRIAMPEGYDGKTPVGAVIFAHGYGGTAAGVMRNRGFLRMASEAGFALIAAQGINGTWDLPHNPRDANSTGAAEFAYFDAVLDDAEKRFSIDPNRIISAGFSAGGMVVWNLACSHPDRYAGFIPMSGTFWLKPPETCVPPVSSIVHIHGDADSTVPLTGRAIRETKQGEVADALAKYTEFGGFGPATPSKSGKLTCQNQSNADGEILEFCLFPGGHSFSIENLRYAIDRLHAAGQI